MKMYGHYYFKHIRTSTSCFLFEFILGCLLNELTAGCNTRDNDVHETSSKRFVTIDNSNNNIMLTFIVSRLYYDVCNVWRRIVNPLVLNEKTNHPLRL